MNALFIGPYRQNDGWGMATRDYIKAIGTQINNITTRPTYFIPNVIEPDNQILGYEKSHYDSYDVVFQKTLPHCIAINKKIKKNVGLFVLETNNLSRSICIKTLNELDEICVPSKQEAKCLKLSGVTTKIKIVSQPIDVDFFHKHSEHKVNLGSLTRKNSFKFYSIGEYIERKNFRDLVIAFHMAFKNIDNVSLVIKTSKSGMSQKQAYDFITQEFDAIKKSLNIKKQYQKELIITERLTDEDMVGLHNSCDCFVMPSHGESFCRPAAEALMLGKTPIVTDNTGMIDFVNNENGFVISSKKSPVILNQRTLSDDFDIYNANEYWYEPNIYSLKEAMLKVFNMAKKDKEAYNNKKKIGIDSSEQFKYETIGHKICD